jgi:peptidoglycan/LPS O-acetylase OafA/YrhL
MTQNALRGTRASDHLDLMRGLAALAVLYQHARFVLIRSDSDDFGPISRVFHLLSRYGHSAVVVFFVLSGYLVGGSIIRSTAAGRWSWRDYLLARGVRLYLVLVPALLLTTVWDRIGLGIVSGSQGNDDTARAMVTSARIAANSGLIPFVGNLAFLQTIAVPSYGSNLPLWSLANEGWYYVIFPCLWLAATRSGTARSRVGHAAVGLAILAFVGPNIRGMFPAWLFGAGLALCPPLRVMESRWSSMIAALPLVGVLGLIGLRWVQAGYVTNYAVAGAVTLLLFAVLHRREPGGSGLYGRWAAMLAGCSYTLYLTHFPLLVCIRARWTYERPWPPDLAHWSIVGFVCLGCLGYAYLLSLLTEAKTDRARRWLVARLD